MIRWRKPPILPPCEYALAAASSIRRIASIWRYSGASSSTVVSSATSSGSMRTDSGVVMGAVTTPRPYQSAPALRPAGANFDQPGSGQPTLGAVGSLITARPEIRPAMRSLEQVERGLCAGRVDRQQGAGAALDAELDLLVALGQLVNEERSLAAHDRLEPQGVPVIGAVELEVEIRVSAAGRDAGRRAFDHPLHHHGADVGPGSALAAARADV